MTAPILPPAEVEALRAENELMREALAGKIASETMLHDIRMQPGSLDFDLQGGAAQLLADAFAKQLKDSKAERYLEISFRSALMPDELVVVTLQKMRAPTPHQMRQKAEAEVAALRALLAEYREGVRDAADWLAKAHGEHDYCEDGWYGCPMHPESFGNEGAACNCWKPQADALAARLRALADRDNPPAAAGKDTTA